MAGLALIPLVFSVLALEVFRIRLNPHWFASLDLELVAMKLTKVKFFTHCMVPTAFKSLRSHFVSVSVISLEYLYFSLIRRYKFERVKVKCNQIQKPFVWWQILDTDPQLGKMLDPDTIWVKFCRECETLISLVDGVGCVMYLCCLIFCTVPMWRIRQF